MSFTIPYRADTSTTFVNGDCHPVQRLFTGPHEKQNVLLLVVIAPRKNSVEPAVPSTSHEASMRASTTATPTTRLLRHQDKHFLREARRVFATTTAEAAVRPHNLQLQTPTSVPLSVHEAMCDVLKHSLSNTTSRYSHERVAFKSVVVLFRKMMPLPLPAIVDFRIGRRHRHLQCSHARGIDLNVTVCPSQEDFAVLTPLESQCRHLLLHLNLAVTTVVEVHRRYHRISE